MVVGTITVLICSNVPEEPPLRIDSWFLPLASIDNNREPADPKEVAGRNTCCLFQDKRKERGICALVQGTSIR